MTDHHPKHDDKGKIVALLHPSRPTNLAAWGQANLLATVTPLGPMPSHVNGLAVAAWADAPSDVVEWERLATACAFDEPLMQKVAGKLPASGAVVVEPDGRVWVVSPSNQYGGYTNTFPKGKLEAKEGLSLRANALKEVFEESGLQVELTTFLCDSVRSTSVTRYYMARRVGGNPADMAWESQAVHLVPQAQLAVFASHPNDQGVLAALHGRASFSSSGS